MFTSQNQENKDFAFHTNRESDLGISPEQALIQTESNDNNVNKSHKLKNLDIQIEEQDFSNPQNQNGRNISDKLEGNDRYQSIQTKSATSKVIENTPIATNFEIDSLASKNFSELQSKKHQNGSFNSYKMTRTDKTDAQQNTMSPTSNSNQGSQFKVKRNSITPLQRLAMMNTIKANEKPVKKPEEPPKPVPPQISEEKKKELQKQLAALIMNFRKNKKPDETKTDQTQKSAALLRFEEAMKVRYNITQIQNQNVADLFQAALSEQFRAKKEYHRKRRASIMQHTGQDGQKDDNMNLNQKQKKDPEALKVKQRKKRIVKVIDSIAVMILMTLITIYSLFFDDIRSAGVSMAFDDVFYGLSCAAMALFTLEIIISSYAKDQYFNSFFFWLDLVSTITMVTDIPWFWDPIIGLQDDGDATNLAKTSIAGRATRVIRIIRLIRLVRIVKLYKQAQLAKQKHIEYKRKEQQKRNSEEIKDLKRRSSVQLKAALPQKMVDDLGHDSDEDGELSEEEEKDQEIPEESKISKTLSDRTTRTIVLLILCLLFVLPYLSVDTYYQTSMYHEQALKQLVLFYNQGPDSYPAYQITYNQFINDQVQNDNMVPEYPLVFLEIVDPNSSNFSNTTVIKEFPPYLINLRDSEVNSLQINTTDNLQFSVVYSIKTSNQIESILNISRTLFVCIVLSLASIFFTKDAQTMVLDPLERMIEKVKLIAKNPLLAASDEVNEAGIMSYYQKVLNKGDSKTKNKVEDESQYETAQLERAIVKIGRLLALGFGEAGSGIIGKNLKHNGELNPLMPGVRTYAIFGFCILDHFVECTEVLQQDIMTYVNQVAEITHSMVDRYGGSANKNIGEAFFLVWKFPKPDEIQKMDEKGEFDNSKICLQNQVLCDTSVFSFLKIIAKINKYNHILKYNQHEAMNEVVPGFKVKMGFGIHQGWAIEGAIGSYFKVDASYLSPNVNMAARLEAATKQFGTILLISGHLKDLLSSDFQRICREIDTVTVKGSIKPMRLFTIDIQTDDLEPIDDPLQNLSIKEKKEVRDEIRKRLFQRFASGESTTWQEFSEDADFQELRKRADPKFEYQFTKGYNAYIKGDWQTAGETFEKLVKARPNDGPSINLDRVINKKHKRIAPPDWQGFRPLTSK